MKKKDLIFDIASVLMIVIAVLTAMLFSGDSISAATAFTIMALLYLIAGTTVIVMVAKEKRANSDRHLKRLDTKIFQGEYSTRSRGCKDVFSGTSSKSNRK